MHLVFSAVSDVGRVRKENQDSGYVGPHLVVICDGVGGAARGDIASSTAVAEIRKLDDHPPPPGSSDADLLGLVSGAIHRAHDRIADLVDEQPALNGTSTTATVAIFDGERLGMGHVGDSRAYLFRDGEIRQLTTDHTFVQSLIDEGRITEDEAKVHPHRNLILRAIDGIHDLEPDLFVLPVHPGDRLLLCSDGASGVLPAGRLADILSSGSTNYAAVELVRASLDAGSSDNVTCLVVDVAADADPSVETPQPTEEPALLVGAAAEMRRRGRRGQPGSLFRGHRAGDTGELEPVRAEILDDLSYAIPKDPLPGGQAAASGGSSRSGLRWVRRLLVVALALGVVWVGLAALWSWSQHRYYVGERDGTVVIYRGVNASFLGFDLATAYESTNVTIARLSDYDAGQVGDGIGVDNLSEAHRTVTNLADKMSQPSPSADGRAHAHDRGERMSTGFVMGFVHRRRRGAELFLLVLALAVGVGAYAAVGVGVQGRVPPDILGYGAGLAALFLGAHVVVRLVAPYADPVLLPVVAALNGLGLAVIHRLDLAYGALPDRQHDFARQQLTWMTLGVILFAATLLILRDHRVLTRFTYTSGLAAIVLLLLPLVPHVGKTINGARIWIGVGPFSFQPGEVAKVLLVVAFAGYLVLHRDALALAGRRVLVVDLPRGRDLGPILAMWLISLGILVFQRDLGSSLLFFGLFLVMLYVATERPGWLVVGALLFFGGAFAADRFIGHVASRVDVWLHPMHNYSTPGQASFQPVEALFGMAWGGLIGRGFGGGSPERVPYAQSDFIFSSIGEELGLTASIAVIVLYGVIVERALRAALVCRDGFGKLMATGLAGVFALQVFVVIGGVTSLIPLTGLTTPFLSYGGSSLVANWVIAALLLRISDQARRPVPDLSQSDDLSDEDDQATQIVRVGGR